MFAEEDNFALTTQRVYRIYAQNINEEFNFYNLSESYDSTWF